MKLSSLFPKHNRMFHILYRTILLADLLLLASFAVRVHMVVPSVWDGLTLCFASISFLGALLGEGILYFEHLPGQEKGEKSL